MSKTKYNLIHTSNLSDWLSKDKLAIMLKNIDKLLLNDGYLIMRRLNGDYQLKEIVADTFNIMNVTNVTDVPNDRSEFYSEVTIAHKK